MKGILRRLQGHPRIGEATAYPILFTIGFCHLLNDMIQSVIPAMYPVLKESYGFTFAQIGLITLVFQLTSSIFQPFVGAYADRHPQPYSLSMGMCLSLAGLLGLAFSTRYAAILLTVALIGGGSSVFHPEASRVAQMASGGRKSLAQSIFQVGGNGGSAVGPLLAALVAAPFFCRQMRAHCFNWVRAVFGGLFLFYVLCVLALVFFPLPDAAQAAKLTTYDAQLVPFQFVADFLRETPLVRSDARTYLPALLDRTVQQVVCNILMLLPLGMYLRYVCGMDLGRITLAALAFSAFIELGQLTGLFFLFRGSYRLCDVDDLMLNTLGGLLGGELVRALEAHLPPIDAFDRIPGSAGAMPRLG